MAKGRASAYCSVVNVHHCVVAYDEDDFRAVAEGADLAVSDSAVLQKAIAFRHGIKGPSGHAGCRHHVGTVPAG